ncbi:MAG: hypothetical protein ABIF87_00100 [Pseudomonadota bacterium]
MNTEELKRVEEVLTLYEIEAVKDLYVEGSLDKSLMEWFLREHGRDDVAVYTADILDVSNTLLLKHGLRFPSNRSKLVALSYELAGLRSVTSSVLCIVDRDYDDVMSITRQNPFLALTDFNSMENYVLSNKHVRKFVTVALGNLPCDIDTLLPQLGMILRQLFYIRAANEKLSWGMKWICPRKYITVRRDSLVFDCAAFVHVLLLKNGRSTQRSTFQKSIDSIASVSPSDDRLAIRGHDLMDILHLVASKLHPKRNYGDTCFFGCAFLASVAVDDLAQYELFRNVLRM